MEEIILKVSKRQLKALNFAIGMYTEMAKNTLIEMNNKPRNFAISTMSIKEQKEDQKIYIKDLENLSRKIYIQKNKIIKE